MCGRRRHGARGLRALRHHLCGVRRAPCLRLHLPRRSPRRTSTSRSPAPCPASPPATARATRRPKTSRSSAGMPNLTIVDPCDAHEIEQAVPAIAAHNGPVYMRLLRGNVPLVLDEYDYRFELGKAKLHPRRPGRPDHLLGLHDHARARRRSKILEATASMPACSTCRRSSRSMRQRSSGRRPAAGRLVVVAENHTDVGGLGEAVAGCCCVRASRRRSARSRCPTSSSTRARCRRCTTATASRRRRW